MGQNKKTQGIQAGMFGLWIYVLHVVALVRPGRPVPTYITPIQADAALDGWGNCDFDLMIEEGRRQYDAQVATLGETRGRAQWLFSVGLALAGADAALATKVFPHPTCAQLIAWACSVAFTSWSALGAAAVITVSASLNGIATLPLSSYAPPIKKQLAKDYADILDVGEQTANTRITLYRQAIVWLILGGYAALAELLLHQYAV